MYCVITNTNLFNCETKEEIVNICLNYYINAYYYNNKLSVTSFLNNIVIIHYENDIIIHKYNYMFIYYALLKKLHEYNLHYNNINNTTNCIDNNNINNNTTNCINNNDIIINQNKPIIKQNNDISIENDSNSLNEQQEEFNRQTEYEHIFSDVVPISKFIANESLPNEQIIQLEKLLKINKDDYTIDNLNELIKTIKTIILKETINSYNIDLINKAITLLCDLITHKFNNDEMKQNISEIIVLFDERLKQYNKQVENYTKHCEYQKKEKNENLKNIYDANKNMYEQIKRKFEENKVDNVDEILFHKLNNDEDLLPNEELIPDAFKIMYYSYKNSDNLEDFIKCFNDFYKKQNLSNLSFFKEFIM